MKNLIGITLLSLAAFIFGFAVRQYRLFPYQLIADIVRTTRRVRTAFFSRNLADIQEMEVINDSSAGTRRRFQFTGSGGMTDPVIWLGGYGRFGEYSPEYGCLAVEFSRNGELLHPIPLRIDEIERMDPIARMPYSDLGFSFRKHTHFFGLVRNDSGDIFTTMHHHRAPVYPYAGGIMRVDRDGHPIWWRRDYSHHAPSIGTHPEFGEVIVTPGMTLHRGDVVYHLGDESLRLRNESSSDVLMDVINVIRPEDGELLQQFSVMDAIRNSPHSAVLGATIDHMDPVHVNSVFVLDNRADGEGLLSYGDFVVSMRSLSAVGILDGRDGSLKSLLRGSFLFQHSARHWKGSKFLLLDNQGTDGTYGPSRLLVIDLMTGTERTIFPNAKTPPSIRARAVTRIRGHVSVSPDLARAICTFPDARFAVEVRLSNGECLSVFENIHDISSFGLLGGGGETKIGTFGLNAIEYLPESSDDRH